MLDDEARFRARALTEEHLGVTPHPRSIVSCRAVTLGLLTLLASPVIGAVVGGVIGDHETQQIAVAVRASNPSDPLDGLPFIFLGDIFLGFVVGSAVSAGLVLGLGAKLFVGARRR